MCRQKLYSFPKNHQMNLVKTRPSFDVIDTEIYVISWFRGNGARSSVLNCVWLLSSKICMSTAQCANVQSLKSS